MGDPIVVTSGRAWRKPREEGVVLQLPSGCVARLRPVDLELVLKLGRVPDSLTPAVVSLMTGESEDLKVETAQQALDMLHLMDAVCEASFVSPRIVDNPQADDEISIQDVEGGDKEFVFGFLNRPARELERFRDAQAGAVDDVESSAGDRTTRQPDPEPEIVGEA